MLLHYYVIRVLCCYVIVLLQYYVIRALCCCVIMLLQCYVMLLRCQGITLLQYYNRVYFTYPLIINILQIILSNSYNLTITICILLYDTD